MLREEEGATERNVLKVRRASSASSDEAERPTKKPIRKKPFKGFFLIIWHLPSFPLSQYNRRYQA